MNQNFRNVNPVEGDAGQEPAENTLRLVATLPVPDGLTSRVHRRIARARAHTERAGFWSLWLPMHRLQMAGAALLVITIGAIGASNWTGYHGKHPDPARQIGLPGTASGGFGTAGKEGHPASLTPIKVPPQQNQVSSAQKKKPSASKAAKHAKAADSLTDPSQGPIK